MATNFFPDNNLLIYYIAEHAGYHAEAEALFEATGLNHEPLKGFLLGSVKQELEDTASDSRLNEGKHFALNELEKLAEKNSLPLLNKKIAYLIENPHLATSKVIVLGEISKKLTANGKIDAEKLNVLVAKIGYKLKNKRYRLENKLFDCKKDESLIKEFEMKKSSNIEELRRRFGAFFPIKESKDVKDNRHILNACCYCGAKKISAWFITQDNLRTGSAFIKKTSEANRIIREILNIDLKISKIIHFLNVTQIVKS